MDLKPLTNTGDVSPEEFSRLFEARLGDLYPKAARALGMLGPMHSFSITNLVHMGLQKDNVEEIVEALDKWCELYPKAPDPITAHVDTKLYFDHMYTDFFVRAGDSINGLGPFVETGKSATGKFTTFGLAPDAGKPQLWTP